MESREKRRKRNTHLFSSHGETRSHKERERERESGKFYLSFSPMSENTCVARVFCASFFLWIFLKICLFRVLKNSRLTHARKRWRVKTSKM